MLRSRDEVVRLGITRSLGFVALVFLLLLAVDAVVRWL